MQAYRLFSANSGNPACFKQEEKDKLNAGTGEATVEEEDHKEFTCPGQKEEMDGNSRSASLSYTPKGAKAPNKPKVDPSRPQDSLMGLTAAGIRTISEASVR